MIGSGCCLKSENKGGICIAYGEDYYYYTYAITEEDFSQLTSGTYEIPEQSKLIQTSQDASFFFGMFNCDNTESSERGLLVCYKLQREWSVNG